MITTIRYKDHILGDRGSRYNESLLYVTGREEQVLAAFLFAVTAD